MPFMIGRGRPPVESPKVGTVSWEEKSVCFVGSNGFYWHGTKFGGWQTEPPDVDSSPENRRKRLLSNPVTKPVSSGRGRRPNGNERVGVDVTYNIEHNCYQTDKKFYWHGTFEGGWKENAPGTDPASDDDDEEEEEKDPNVVGNEDSREVPEEEEEGGDTTATATATATTTTTTTTDGSNKKQKRGNTKGRPPRGKTYGELIEYDTEKLCWTSDRDGGIYWHGTYNGGWKDHPPKKR